jgi:CelD/BcsL family acetyltransferase involved in cellulose biosynthesis
VRDRGGHFRGATARTSDASYSISTVAARHEIEIHDAIEPIADEWEELAVRIGADPFRRPGWFSCWLESFGSQGLKVLAVRREGRLAAVLPVFARRGTVHSVTNWHTPRFAAVAADASAEESVLEGLFRDAPRRVDLSFLPTESVERLRRAAGRRSFSSRPVLRSPYVKIEGDWDSYLRGLTSKARSNLRRRRKRLAERGEVAIEVVEGGSGLEALLEESFRIEASGWKGAQNTAIVSSADTERFYRRLAHWAADVEILRLALLRLDGRLIASNLSLESEGSHYLVKIGHDAELGQWAPGTVLTAAMIERAFSLRLKSYEFLGDAAPYKLQWTSTCRDLMRAQAFAGSPLGRIDRLAQTRGRALAKKFAGRTP